MFFDSLLFLCFWLVVWAAHWRLRSEPSRHWLLLAASFVFYACNEPWHVPLLLAVMVIGWGAGWQVGRARAGENDRAAKAWLWLGVGSCLLLLGFYKYTGFFLATAQALLQAVGWQAAIPQWQPGLPVGVSFFVFHAICYLVDVYRRALAQAQSFRHVSLYIGFFPHLVAGPIVRATDFVPQLEQPKKLENLAMLEGLRLVLIGFVAKSVFANHLADFADPVFAAPAAYNQAAILGAVLGYHAQIYFDFFGYSLMAIGIAKTLGYWFPPNFDHPYAAVSIADFWRRWHISLSRWLRDYLYISLGGNRGSMAFVCRNLFLTMLLGGLWHGASWNFVIWGALHGVALCAQRLWAHWRGKTGERAADRSISSLVAGWLATQVFVILCWIPFRCASLDDTFLVLRSLLGLGEGTKGGGVPWLLIFLPLAVDTFLIGRTAFWERHRQFRTGLLHAALIVGFVLALLLMYLGTKPFIYFQF